MSSDDVRPATDEEVREYRRRAERGGVLYGIERAVLARLAAAEKLARELAERCASRTKKLVAERQAREAAEAALERNIEHHAERDLRLKDAEADAAYQKARADALLHGNKVVGNVPCCPWCRSYDRNLDTGERAHFEGCPADWPTERPDGWTKEG